MPRYDRQEMLFHLDWPHYGHEKGYNSGNGGKEGFAKESFEQADVKKMASLLKTIEGHFILPPNDRPEVRETLKDFHIESVKTHHSIATRVHEVRW